MSATMSRCEACGEQYDLTQPHTCNREAKLERALHEEMAENDRLRAALADERKHADELAEAYRQVMPGCALIEHHDARRKEQANG